MSRIMLRGARPFDDQAMGPLDVVLEGEKIEFVGVAGAGSTVGCDVVDVGGLLALPGLIDAHVHPIHDETPATVGRAAAAGGVTTVGLHLYPGPDEPFDAAVRRLQDEAASGTADFAAHVRLDARRCNEDLSGIFRSGAVSTKVFLAHPDKNVQATFGNLVSAMTRCASAGLPVIVHAELGDVVDAIPAEGLVDTGSSLTLEDLAQWRSPEIEAAAVSGAASVAAATGATLYIAHVSCGEALRAALHARASGVPVIVETCPHYLFLTAADAAALGGLGRVLPPLRTSSDVAALRRAVADGNVDVVASDHCGHGPTAKRFNDVAGSKAGLPGTQHLASLLIDAALDGRWVSPRAAVKVLAEGPAQAFKLKNKGKIAAGYDADITLVDPTAKHTIHANESLDASNYSPYEGRELRGTIETVFRRGEQVLSDGVLQVEEGGKFVRRSDGG